MANPMTEREAAEIAQQAASWGSHTITVTTRELQRLAETCVAALREVRRGREEETR